ncbi:MAG: helix-turn-helix transcriptional regulator [Burkholderiaceae bacterium]
MNFRNATSQDIGACIDLVRADGGFVAESAVWDALPQLWHTALNEDALASFQVFEKAEDDGYKIVAFRLSAFFTEAFAASYEAAPHGQVAAEVWRRVLAGNSPMLDRASIARENARGTLKLGVLHWATRQRDPLNPETLRVLSLVPGAWQAGHGGYRLEQILFYEMFYTAAAKIMSNIGYRTRECTPRPGEAADAEPAYVFYWPKEDSALGLAALIPAIATSKPIPRFRLTRTQQRLIIAALEGFRDKDIAESLGVRYDTVRQNWHDIYQRIDRVDAAMLPGEKSGDGRRGEEKRRVLIEYMRQHREELRPFDWGVFESLDMSSKVSG